MDTPSKRHRPVGDKFPATSVGDSQQDERDSSIPAHGPANEPSGSRFTRIARRAHEIYEARGGEHGKAMADWLQAEREVDAEMDG